MTRTSHLWAMLLALLSLLAFHSPAPAQDASPETIARRFATAWAAGDAAAIAAQCSEDALVIDGWPSQFAVRGRPAIKEWAHKVLALQAIAPDPSSFSVQGQTVTWTYRSHAHLDRRMGLPAAELTATAVVSAGQISHFEPVSATTAAQRAGNQAAAEAASRTAAAWLQAQPTVDARTPPEATREAYLGAERARATSIAASGALQHLPRPQERGTPSPALWGAAAVLSLAGVCALALLGRLHAPDDPLRRP